MDRADLKTKMNELSADEQSALLQTAFDLFSEMEETGENEYSEQFFEVIRFLTEDEEPKKSANHLKIIK